MLETNISENSFCIPGCNNSFTVFPSKSKPGRKFMTDMSNFPFRLKLRETCACPGSGDLQSSAMSFNSSMNRLMFLIGSAVFDNGSMGVACASPLSSRHLLLTKTALGDGIVSSTRNRIPPVSNRVADFFSFSIISTGEFSHFSSSA